MKRKRERRSEMRPTKSSAIKTRNGPERRKEKTEEERGEMK
jgi:hypothetical protein